MWSMRVLPDADGACVRARATPEEGRKWRLVRSRVDNGNTLARIRIVRMYWLWELSEFTGDVYSSLINATDVAIKGVQTWDE